MQKEKRRPGEVVKIFIASLALVGVFGAALFGANHLAFANAQSRTMEVPPFEAMSVSQNIPLATVNNMGVSIANALSAEQTPRRNLNVIEVAFDAWVWGNQDARNENTLSAEEAAQIGAQYIYEIFGECIDGATVQMSFSGHLRHRGTLGVWTGTVGDGVTPDGFGDDIEFPIGKPMFLFLLNSETGEAIHVEQITNFGDGIVMLNPRSDAPITMDIDFNMRGFGWDAENRLGDAEVRREIHFRPLNPEDIEGWDIQWEIPNHDSIWRIDDLDEFFRNFEGSGVSIFRRITPPVPTTPQDPPASNNGNGHDT